MKQKFEFDYEVYENISELKKEDAELLEIARATTTRAYAPYSNFFVSAAGRVSSGQIVAGTNQENASYPVGICAERVLLGNIATYFPKDKVETIAISFSTKKSKADHPISPCGMCRQALLEYEERTNAPIRVILSGQEGKIFIIKTVKSLLPFAFGSDELT
jgi:cytidine deaminase